MARCFVLLGCRRFREALDLQVFKDDDLILTDQLVRDFVLEIFALVGDLAVIGRYPLYRLFAPMAPLLLSCHALASYSYGACRFR